MKRYKGGGDIEGMSEEKLNRLSEAAYNKAMPSPEPGEAPPKMAMSSTGAGAGRGFVNPKSARPAKKMAKGGSASSRGDGCACKGKTKGRIV